jgi:hypothetical protein
MADRPFLLIAPVTRAAGPMELHKPCNRHRTPREGHPIVPAEKENQRDSHCCIGERDLVVPLIGDGFPPRCHHLVAF